MTKELKTIKVQKNVWQTAKIEAAKQNISLEGYVTNALAAYLKKTKEGA
jgi:predicted HicB family RNase H-like nuclease